MGIYELNLSDGTQVEVEAPDDVTNDELLKLARRQRRATKDVARQERQDARASDIDAEMAALKRTPIPEETGMLGDLAKGFGAGFVGTGEMAALGAATLLNEETEVAARDKIQGFADAIKPSGGDKDDISYKIGQTFGSIAGFAAPIAGIAAGIAALPVAAPTAAVATGAGALLGVGTAAGEASERARAAGATEEQRNRAIRTAAPFGLLEVAPLGRFMKSVDIPVISNLIDKLGPEVVETAAQRVQNAAATGVAEGAQEAVSEIIQNLAERGYNPEREILSGSGESAALGGGAGAAIQFLVDAFTNSRKTGPATETAEPTQLEMDLQGGIGAAPRPGLRTNFEGEQGEMFADVRGLEPSETTVPEQERTPDPKLVARAQNEIRVYGTVSDKTRRLLEDSVREPVQTEFDFGKPSGDADLVDRMQQKLLTGPDDLGIQLDDGIYTDVPYATTRDQRTARTSEGLASLTAVNKKKAAVIEQAKAELQNDGMITPETRKDIEANLTPKEADEAFKDTRYEPILSLLAKGALDNRPVGDVQRDLTLPREGGIKDLSRFESAVEAAKIKQGATLPEGQGAVVTREEAAIEADLAAEQTDKASLAVRKGKEPKLGTEDFIDVESDPRVDELIQEIARDDSLKAAEQQANIRKGIQKGEDAKVDDAARADAENRPLTGAVKSKDRRATDQARPLPSSNYRTQTEMLEGEGVGTEPTVEQRQGDFLDKLEQVSDADSFITPRPAQGTAETQGELFTEGPQRPAAKLDPKVEPVARKYPGGIDLDAFLKSRKEQPDVEPSNKGTSGDGDAGAGPKREGGRGAETSAGASESKTSDGADVGRAGRRASEPRGGTGKGDSTLNKRKLFRGYKKGTDEAANLKAEGYTFYTADKKTAEGYASAYKNEGVVAETDVDLGKTLTGTIAEIQAALGLTSANYKKFRTAALKEGYDSIEILRNQQGDRPFSEIMVLSKEQTDAEAQNARVTALDKGKPAEVKSKVSLAQPPKGVSLAKPLVPRKVDPVKTGGPAVRAAEKLQREADERAAQDEVVTAVVEYNKIKDPTAKESTAILKLLKEILPNGVKPKSFLEKARNLNRTQLKGTFKLPTAATLDLPLTPSAIAAVKKGDLKGALEILAATSVDPLTANLAKAYVKNLGNTKLVVRANLKSDDGVPVSGYFDPKTNTIVLDKTAGINQHTLLHEMMHAVTVAPLANKSHPLTKKISKIFEGIKEQLSGEYGLTSVEEFVAEYRTNPDFLTQLQLTTVNGRNPFQQLTRAIANFVRTLMGRSTVPETSTFDAVDNLVQDLMSPTFEGRNASKMYMMVKTVEGSKKIINNLAAKTIEADNKYIDNARDFLGESPENVRAVFLKFMPVNILGKLAKSKIAEAPLLNDIVNNMSNALRAANEKLTPLVEDIREMKNSKSPKMAKDFATLSYLIPNASFYRIDPRQPDFKKAYVGKKGEKLSSAEVKELHTELRTQFESMGAPAQKLYRTITNMFESRMDDVEGAIDENLKATMPDEASYKAASKRLKDLLTAERGLIRPFAPLTRDGNYRLEFVTIDPRTGRPEQYVEHFDGVSARERAKKNLAEYNAKALAKLPNTVEGNKHRAYITSTKVIEGVRGANFNFDKAPEGSFVYNLLQTLKAKDVPQGTYDSVVELVLDSMPERSFMQSFRKRGDVRGFQGDITPTGMAQDAFDLLNTVQGKGRDYNRQIIQMTYGAKIQRFKNEVNKKYKSEDLDTTTALYKKTLFDIANFAQSPNVSRWSQNLTSFGYAWTMGLNLSSAATAVFDVPMSVGPRLMGKYGDKKAIYALGRAANILKNSPKEKLIDAYSDKVDANGVALTEKRKVKGGMAGFSIVNYDFAALRGMSEADLKKEGITKKQQKELLDLEVLANVGSENAQFSQSLNQEHMDVTRGKDRLEMLNAVTSFLFHHSERYSREVTMVSTYQLELDRLRNNPKPNEKTLADGEKQRMAALEAVRETETSLGATSSAGRPVIAQSAVGNVFMLFKRFAISKYAMMVEMTNDAFKGAKTAEEKQDRAIARGQLGRFMVASGAFAGVAGMPLMGAFGMLYDIASDEEDDNFEAVLDKTFGETLTHGLVNAALGSDMASRIEMNSLLYRPPFINKDQSQLWTLAEQLGGPAVGIYLSMERGIGLMNEGEFVRGTEAVMPAAIRNVMKAGRYSVDGAETRRGDAITEDLGITQLLLQSTGLAPTAIVQQHRRNKNNRDKEDYLKTTRIELLRGLNLATAEGDRQGYRDALAKIREYNRNLPRAARERKLITPDTMDRSAASFVKRTSKMVGGIEYTPFMLDSLSEYDRGILGM
mgnify:CR=1 FL=1